MKNRSTISEIIQDLDGTYSQLSEAKPRQTQQIEKNLQAQYTELCTVYPDISPEQRVDVATTLLYRDRLLAQLVLFFRNITKQGAQLAERKRQENQARQLMKQSVAAFSLLEHKVIISTIESTEHQMLQTCAALGIDPIAMLESMDVTYRDYVLRAAHYQKQRDRIRAIKALSMALKHNPRLEDDLKVRQMAAALTGETEMSAVLTLSDGFVVQKFIQQIERARKARSEESDKSRSTMEIIRSWFDGD